MKRYCKIYGLKKSKLSNEIRYVGKTTMTLNRKLQSHIGECKRNESPHLYKNRWLKKILKENFNPVIVLLEYCNDNNILKREFYWIKRLKEKGHKLTNAAEFGIHGSNIKSTSTLQYDKNGIFMKEWKSISLAEKILGTKHRLIESAICRYKNNKPAKGGKWFWIKNNMDYIPFKIEIKIDWKSNPHKLIDTFINKIKTFDSLKKLQYYFKLKSYSFISKCRDENILYKKRYKICKI